MAQINKLKKENDNSRIVSLTLENDDLLQSAEIDQSRKDQAKAVIDFAQLVIDAEDFTGRDSRLYRLGIAEKVNKILKGEQAYSKSMTGGAKTNVFGYYSRHGAPSELDWMVNETVRRVMSSNNESQLQTTVYDQLDTAPVNLKQIANVTPGAGFNPYVLPTTTTNDKVKKFAAHLHNWLTNYLQNPYDQEKYVVNGINQESVANFSKYVSMLDLISKREANSNDILAIGDIVSALGNEDLTNAFESYFANELEGSEAGATNQPVIPGLPASTISVGDATLSLAQHPDSNFNKYLSDKGYTLYKDAAGNFYLKQGENLVTSDFAETDPSSSYYKHGVFVDPTTGRLISYGNLSDSNYLASVKDRWAALAPKIRQEYLDKFKISDYTSQGGSRGIDFSHYLPGNDVVFIDGDRLKAWEEGSDAWMPFNQWFQNWDLIKSQFDWGGNADISQTGLDLTHQYADQKGLFNNEEFLNLIQDIEKLSDEDLNKILGKVKDTGIFLDDSAKEIFESANGATNSWNTKTKLAAFVGYYLIGKYDKVNKLFPNNLKETQYIIDGEKVSLGDAFIKLLRSKNNKELYRKVLRLLLGTTLGTVEDTKALKQKVREELQNIDKLEEFAKGGILKCADGSGLKQKSEQTSTSNSSELTLTKVFDGNLTSKQKAMLWMTGASILNDLTSIGTAYIPVAGPYISGAQAIAGMGVDLATDIMSGTSTGETVKNAALSGLTGTAGLVVGSAKLAKAGLWAKRIGNIFRHILGISNFADAVYRFGFDKETQTAFSKLFTSPSELTVQDWIKIGHGLRSIANTTTSHSARNRVKTDASTTTINPSKKLIVQRNKETGAKTYKQVSTKDISKVSESELPKWNLVGRHLQRVEKSKSLADEGYETVLGFRGKPRTRDVVEFDPLKQAARLAQSDRFVPESLRKAFGYEGYNPGSKAGDKANEWDLNINLRTTIQPTVVNKARLNSGKEIKVYGIKQSDFDNGKVSQIAPGKLQEIDLSVVRPEKSVLDALPKNIKKIYRSLNGTIIFVSEPKSQKTGGKLDKLQNYINNK